MGFGGVGARERSAQAAKGQVRRAGCAQLLPCFSFGAAGTDVLKPHPTNDDDDDSDDSDDSDDDKPAAEPAATVAAVDATNDPPAWLLKKWVVLTIIGANGAATMPQYRAHPDMPVQRLKHELSVLPESPFVDGDELRVVSSPMHFRPLNNTETLAVTVAHGLSGGISQFLSRILSSPELVSYVTRTPGMEQKQAQGVVELEGRLCHRPSCLVQTVLH